MTRGHRRAHALLWRVLGPLILIGLAAAIAGRPREAANAPSGAPGQAGGGGAAAAPGAGAAP